MKQCPQCRKEGVGPKSFTDFSKSVSRASGYQDYCKIHQRMMNRKAYDRLTPEANRARSASWRKANPVGYRALWIRRNLKKYGLTEQTYQLLFDAQRGRCAICQIELINQIQQDRPFNGFAHNAVSRVDHCHKTGRVRGLLCFQCNVGLGKFRDDEQVLLTAARYLRATSQTRACETATEISRACDVNAQGEKRADEGRDLESSTSRESRLQERSPLLN